MTEHLLYSKPEGLKCEAMVTVGKGPLKAACGSRATHVYGPECEAETGKLMYLCNGHAGMIRDWRSLHLYDPVDCPTHGRIGRVKDYLILKAM